MLENVILILIFNRSQHVQL